MRLDMTQLSTPQQLALAITPKCTASLGIPSSIFLISEVACDYRSGKGTSAVQRTLVGVAVIDILSSFAWFLSSWAVPRESGFALAAGTRGSCTFQGFLLQLAVGAPLYNSSLSLFYLLMIKYNWSDVKLAALERWVHGLILLFAVGTSIVLIPLKQFNQVGAVCWIDSVPNECGTFQNSRGGGAGVPCERGENAWIYGLTLFYGPLWICVIACVIIMIQVYRSVRATMMRARRYSLTRSRRSMGQNETTVVAIQAALYTLSFLVTWMPSTIWSIAHWFGFSSFLIDFAASFFEPLQGFWNLLIFLRTRAGSKTKIKKAAVYLCPCLVWHCCCPAIKNDLDDDPTNRTSRMNRSSFLGQRSASRGANSGVNTDSMSTSELFWKSATHAAQASPGATATASTTVRTGSLDIGLHIQSSSNCNKTSEVGDEETTDSSPCSPQEQGLACKIDNHGIGSSHILTSVLKHGNNHGLNLHQHGDCSLADGSSSYGGGGGGDTSTSNNSSSSPAHRVTFATNGREQAVFDSSENDDDQGKHQQHHHQQQQDESSFSSRLQKDKNRQPCSAVANGDYSLGNDSISSAEFPISTIEDPQQEQDFSDEYEKNNGENNNNINNGNTRDTGPDAPATALLVMEVEPTDKNGDDNNGERDCDGIKINVV